MRPLLRVERLSKRFGPVVALDDVSLEVYPGRILGLVGESGSGKTSLLRAIVGELDADSGELRYEDAAGVEHEIAAMDPSRRRALLRTEWGLVHQNPRDGLRMHLSAGANVAERLLDGGVRHYGNIRAAAREWLERVEIPVERIDDRPSTFSGGMQQRLQLARVLVTGPRLLLMDEPTGGLDVSVQARLLDLIRTLVRRLGLCVLLVTHDMGVVRLLADELAVMRHGRIVERGIVDQVLDDPQHAYSQLLVSAALTP